MDRKWWHDKVAYQIYPKSFYDSNGDGIGDIPGIISKLDYLKDLGVDIIWLSPIYKSPLADEGYDIADYYSLDPRFGTMEDMERLIAETKKRDMYILMDLVVNHCSDEHEWFKKACEDPEGKYGEFFYIRDQNPDGSLPTNWRSYFGGPAWEKVPGTDKFYLHMFHKKQPDLNWENPEVRTEVYKNINWWLDKGIAGFRIDAIMNIKKASIFKSYEPDRDDGMVGLERMLKDAKGISIFLHEMQDKTFSQHDAFSVGEVFNDKEDELSDLIGEGGCFSSIFDFESHIFGASRKGWYASKPCLPEDYKSSVFKSQLRAAEIGFFSNIIENHDEPRGVSRYIPKEELSIHAKKALACAYFLLRGIPFIYQGQEIGMENTEFQSVSDFDDISSIMEYDLALEAGLSKEEALECVSKYSRDNARTPVQWTDGDNAGFTTGKPWLPVNKNYKEINVESQEKDSKSLLAFYKELIALRKAPEYKETFVYGSFEPYLRDEKNLMAYIRKGNGKTILVAANLQRDGIAIPAPGRIDGILLDNVGNAQLGVESIKLDGYQALVLEIA
ncbi:MAG: alpha-glucosidase [Lachnospiraceae bacterium]|nr:alpha-glucosidase [Lachnospiraceae bacterium]